MGHGHCYDPIIYYPYRGNGLTQPQLKVTAARPGTVNFELDIQKEHTVRNNLGFEALMTCS